MARELDGKLVDEAVKTIQMLAVDTVEKANSGHPGAPMGLACLAFELWMRHLRFDPADPSWPGRDRFVLSAGHASALLYALLHLSGYDLPLAELKSFRQWGSKTPGHPEVHLTPGVETTTGPLGQGIANAVGMAIAEKMRAARLDEHEEGLFGGRVFGIASDGDNATSVLRPPITRASRPLRDRPASKTAKTAPRRTIQRRETAQRATAFRIGARAHARDAASRESGRADV